MRAAVHLPLLLLHPRGRPQPPHRLRLLLHWHLHSVTRPVTCRPRYIRLRPARRRVRRTARCVCVCLLPLSIVSNPHPSLLCLSFAPKCGLIMEVFAAWLTRHVTCDNADTQWLYHPSTSTTTAAACCNANFFPSCICVTLCTCALPRCIFVTLGTCTHTKWTPAWAWASSTQKSRARQKSRA